MKYIEKEWTILFRKKNKYWYFFKNNKLVEKTTTNSFNPPYPFGPIECHISIGKNLKRFSEFCHEIY